MAKCLDEGNRACSFSMCLFLGNVILADSAFPLFSVHQEAAQALKLII